jgi:hypothetical protein
VVTHVASSPTPEFPIRKEPAGMYTIVVVRFMTRKTLPFQFPVRITKEPTLSVAPITCIVPTPSVTIIGDAETTCPHIFIGFGG